MNPFFNDQRQYLKEILGNDAFRSMSGGSCSELLEGVAYLTGELQRYISEDLTYLDQMVLNQMAPDFLKPFVSRCIVQFEFEEDYFTQSVLVPKDTRLSIHDSRNHHTYYFTLDSDIEVNPIKILQARLVTKITPQDTLELEVEKISSAPMVLDKLVIYIQADLEIASYWYQWFLTKVQSIFINEQLVGNQMQIKSHNFFTQSNNEASIFEQIKIFLNAPEQLFFIKIAGFPKVTLSSEQQRFTLRFLSDETIHPPAKIKEHLFCFNAVPVANLFHIAAEPITTNDEQLNYRLIPDVSYPETIYFHAIDSVNSVTIHGTGKIEQNNYRVIRRRNQLDDSLIYLELNPDSSIFGKTLSSKIEVSNGPYPENLLHVGIRFELEDLPDSIRPVCLTNPSPWIDFDLHRAKELKAYLDFTLHPFSGVNNLKAILDICNVSKNPQVTKKIQAILKIDFKIVPHCYRGVFYHLAKISIDWDLQPFHSPSERYLWLEMLYHVFLRYVPMNTLLEVNNLCLTS